MIKAKLWKTIANNICQLQKKMLVFEIPVYRSNPSTVTLVHVCEREINPEFKKPDHELRMRCKRWLRVGVTLLADGELAWLVVLCHTKLRARKEEAVGNSGEGWTRGSRRFIKRCSWLCFANVSTETTSTILEKQTFLQSSYSDTEAIQQKEKTMIVKWTERPLAHWVSLMILTRGVEFLSDWCSNTPNIHIKEPTGWCLSEFSFTRKLITHGAVTTNHISNWIMWNWPDGPSRWAENVINSM